MKHRINWQERDEDSIPPLAQKSNINPPLTRLDILRMREYSNQLSNFLSYKIPQLHKHEARHLTSSIIEEQNRVYKWLQQYEYEGN